MSTKKIRVLMCPANGEPYLTNMENALKLMQEAVGGYTKEVVTKTFLVFSISKGKNFANGRQKRADGNTTILRVVFSKLLLNVNGTQLVFVVICHCCCNDGAKDCTEDRDKKSCP